MLRCLSYKCLPLLRTVPVFLVRVSVPGDVATADNVLFLALPSAAVVCCVHHGRQSAVVLIACPAVLAGR